MDTQRLPGITTPTALINSKQAKSNLQKLFEKAAVKNIRFRPHFKTHQSGQIGEWFRDAGVTTITVSSVRMAAYFAACGWEDILIAFPVNLREIEEIKRLSAKVNLSLLVESADVVESLADFLTDPVNIWIKIDSGMQRAGIAWEKLGEIENLCKKIITKKNLKLSGILTHAGQTYHAGSKEEIVNLYRVSNQRMIELRARLKTLINLDLQVSVGDTPGCWLSDDLGEVDEIRPGNFLLFDAMMMDLGVCEPEEIAMIVACPVVAKHPDRNEIVIYGGAVNLSKDFLLRDGKPIYGYIADLSMEGWQFSGSENYVLSLSQEHGIVKASDRVFAKVKIGDLMGIIPVHSCLAVDALGSMLDFEGIRYETMRAR